MKTFSLSRHSRLFSVPDDSKDYLFVSSGNHPYQEEPYRAESYAIVYIKEGAVRLNTGLVSRDVKAPSVITLGPAVIRYFTKSSDLLKMDVIFFKDSFLLERHADAFFLTRYNFFDDDDLHVLSLQDDFLIKLSRLFELIQLTQVAANYHRGEIIRSYIFALVYEIDAYYRQDMSGQATSLRGHNLFTRFRHLLSGNYMHQRKLDFYASHLHVTPKSLSAAIKKKTGRSAGKWINDAIILEAKVLLQNKMLTISQVSGMLNFSDQSVFGKFFRAGTGMSPFDYRKKFN